MKSIFLDCNDQLSPVWTRVIRPDDPKIDVNMTPFSREELTLMLAGYDIALDDHSYMPTEQVARCKQLKHIVFLGTGAASYMNVEELKATASRSTHQGLWRHRGGRTFDRADVCLRPRRRAHGREVRGGIWTPQEGVQLFGKTLGVIGLGGIGREVARLAKGIGMEVIAFNRTRRDGDGVTLVDIDTLLARADAVSMNLTLGDETRGFLSAQRIARMKPGVIFINTARGALVDEAALIAALKSGHIRHAGLDVFHTEPLKGDHALAALPNVTLTSHAAFRTLEASMTLLRRAIDIVRTIIR